MSNPIDGSGRPLNNPLQDPRTQSRGDAERVTDGQRPASDPGQGQGSSEARESERLQAVREQIDQTPEVDRARVDELRERIANGEYPLDAERIAERFAELEGLLER